MKFDDFNRDNNSFGERDFVKFEHGDDTVVWKIDHYSKDMKTFSDDPSDPAQTTRVLALMSGHALPVRLYSVALPALRCRPSGDDPSR